MIGWEKSLNQVAQAGYSYGYTSYIDTSTGQKIFLVDAIKGDGPRIAVVESTILSIFITRRSVRIFVDPGSGQGSMSRLGVGVLVSSFGGFMALCVEGRLSLEAMRIIADVFKWAFPSVALVYGVNSAITAWRRPQAEVSNKSTKKELNK